jgi:serine/threonine protein kinase
MPPEQAMGEPVGPASDLYSLEVVLYEMLTGEALFRAEYPAAIATELPYYRVKLSRGGVVGSVTFFIFPFFPTDPNPMTEKGTLDPSSRERGKKAANRSHRERNRISLLS